MGKDPLRTGRLTTTEVGHGHASCEAWLTGWQGRLAGRIRRRSSLFEGMREAKR